MSWKVLKFLEGPGVSWTVMEVMEVMDDPGVLGGSWMVLEVL